MTDILTCPCVPGCDYDTDANGCVCGGDASADTRHHFEITFTSRFDRSDWWGPVSAVVTVRADNLPDALRAAAGPPVRAWFDPEYES